MCKGRIASKGGYVIWGSTAFQNFQNLIPLLFFIEFKIRKVGRMHSYECRRKRDVAFGLEVEEKWVIKLTHARASTQKQRNRVCFRAPCIGSAFAPIPEPGTPSSDSATAFKMLLTLGNKTSCWLSFQYCTELPRVFLLC